MTSGEANQYRTAESTRSQQKYRRRSLAAPAPQQPCPHPTPDTHPGPGGATGTLTCKRVTWGVISTHGGPLVVAKQQALRQTLQIFSSPGCFVSRARWDPLSRNNGLRLVCSIARIQGLWAEQAGSGGALSMMHGRRSLKVIALCYFKYAQGEAKLLLL